MGLNSNNILIGTPEQMLTLDTVDIVAEAYAQANVVDELVRAGGLFVGLIDERHVHMANLLVALANKSSTANQGNLCSSD